MATKSTSVKLTLKITSFILRLLMNIVFYVLVVILIINFSKMAFEFTYQLYGPVSLDKAPGREVIMQINKGESTMDVAGKLELNRVIVNKYSFYLKTKLQDKVILAGTYKLNSSMTYEEILNTVTDYQNSIIQDADKGTGNSGQSPNQNSGQSNSQAAGDNTNTDQNKTDNNTTNTDKGSDKTDTATGE